MDLIETAVDHLRSGRVVGVPTDTVYGVAADPLQRSAVQGLFALKGRDRTKPIGLLLPDAAEASEWIEVPEYASGWVKRFWPGPLTLVATASRRLPDGVGDRLRHTVGVRVPDHPVARRLLSRSGSLAVTSANQSGGEETLDDVAARATLGEAVALYLPGRCPGTVASTVVDVTGAEPRILRTGPVDLGV